jgi:hypothetical protein
VRLLARNNVGVAREFVRLQNRTDRLDQQLNMPSRHVNRRLATVRRHLVSVELTCVRSLRRVVQLVLKLMQSHQVSVAVIHDNLNLMSLNDVIRPASSRRNEEQEGHDNWSQ